MRSTLKRGLLALTILSSLLIFSCTGTQKPEPKFSHTVEYNDAISDSIAVVTVVTEDKTEQFSIGYPLFLSLYSQARTYKNVYDYYLSNPQEFTDKDTGQLKTATNNNVSKDGTENRYRQDVPKPLTE